MLLLLLKILYKCIPPFNFCQKYFFLCHVYDSFMILTTSTNNWWKFSKNLKCIFWRFNHLRWSLKTNKISSNCFAVDQNFKNKRVYDCHRGFMRPQNLPLSRNFMFSWKILFSPFFIFLTQVILKSDNVPKVSIVSFFYSLVIVLKLPVCFKLLYWKLPSLLLLPLITLHLKLNPVLSTSSFTCMTIDAIIYTTCCTFVYCYFKFVLLPLFFSLVLDCYGQIPWFRFFSIYNLVFSDSGLAKKYLRL